MSKEEVKELYDKLSKDNKEILNLLAKGMIVAQENRKEK